VELLRVVLPVPRVAELLVLPVPRVVALVLL
jgi:hypothetical protein